MRIRTSAADLSQVKADLAIYLVAEGDSALGGVSDRLLRRELQLQMKREGFTGKSGERLVWNVAANARARRLLLIGLGAASGSRALRMAVAAGVRQAATYAATSIAICLPKGSAHEAVRAVCEGAQFGAYRFDKYVTEKSRRAVRPAVVEIALPGAKSVREAVHRGEIGGAAVNLARDLVNEAPSRLTPRQLASKAAALSRASGIVCKVIGATEIGRLGLTALAAVSRGSSEPPRVVHLTYRPKKAHRRAKRSILLVGKGVTFDSGGLNLKPGNSMLTMKGDMGGAAAVLATMTALRDIGCRAEVHGLLGLVENMTGGDAYKPGDILDTHAGKTVEIGNTDAEGRLVLCDLLSYGVASLKPTEVIDVATLTGACVVALGTEASGLFTRHDALRDSLLQAAELSGERFWPLPLYDEYLALLQKGPADLCNVGGRWGGAITAGLFLGEFVPRELPWAHLDIAGPAFAENETPDRELGGTGAAVSTLLRWLEAK